MDLITLHRQWKKVPDKFLEKEISTQLDCLIFSVIKSEGYAPFIRPQEDYFDLLQDLRVLCWKRWTVASTEPEHSFIPFFMMTIKGYLKNKLRNTQHCAKKEQIISTEYITNENSLNPEKDLVNHLEIDLFLKELSPTDNTILKKSLQGCSLREISSHVSMSKSSVHNRLTAIKSLFKDRSLNAR